MRIRLSLVGVALILSGCAPTNDQMASATPPPHAVPTAPAPEPAPAPAPTPAEVAEAAPAGLPEGPGRETTIRVCSGCHEVELVMDKRLTRQEWFDLVQFMGDRGAIGTPAEFAEITDYLATHFPKS